MPTPEDALTRHHRAASNIKPGTGPRAGGPQEAVCSFEVRRSQGRLPGRGVIDSMGRTSPTTLVIGHSGCGCSFLESVGMLSPFS